VIYAYPTCIRPPRHGRGARRNIAMPFGMEKLQWCGYPMVKNVEDTLIRFDRMYERDGHTHRQTLHDGIGRTCEASRGRNQRFLIIECL